MRSLKLCQECGWVGSRDFYAQIWALQRHRGHMGSMLDADWLKNFLLRSDWSGPKVASITTENLVRHKSFQRMS